ncbi:hypothetical protein [Amycolatopsis anabasis]|uniref:hypothetical protein n=1 Tax=Amycolatopsis anabasis TaxID=1840409 RepID=UPI001FE3BC42|nr:hypothetical protein [Amycolatopsis anabasis]
MFDRRVEIRDAFLIASHAHEQKAGIVVDRSTQVRLHDRISHCLNEFSHIVQAREASGRITAGL